MQAQMLAPAAVLIAWSLVMMVWMAATRLPAMKAKIGSMANAKPGGRGQDLEGVLDDRINWKGHNYAHLMEQPTLFYAASLIIALLGAGAGDIYPRRQHVALRIVHSIWQSTVNVVSVRFLLFALSSLALVWLAVRALSLALFPELVAA